MKILVTGAFGMLGRAFCKLAHDTEHELLTPTHKELELIDQTQVDNYFATHKIDCVLHMAAIVGGIQKNINHATNFLLHNTYMGFNVLQSALKHNVKKFINIGSSCMYPKDRMCLKEEDVLTGVLEPTNEAYAIAKISTAILCKTITRQYNLLYRTVVPCNLYGPHDNFDLINSHMIPAAINKIHYAKINNINEVEIWGDGTARREFMHVGDAADFLLFAVDHLSQLPEMINLGLGYDFSIDEYYEKIATVIGYQGKFKHDLTKPIGTQGKLLNIEKLKPLGWQSKINLKTGLSNTYNFFVANQ